MLSIVFIFASFAFALLQSMGGSATNSIQLASRSSAMALAEDMSMKADDPNATKTTTTPPADDKKEGKGFGAWIKAHWVIILICVVVGLLVLGAVLFFTLK